MEPMPFVLDISSDEEGFEKGHNNIDYDDLIKFLGMSDAESDDSDDVLVVGEVKADRQNRSTTTPAVKDVEEDDDDCVVLDGDPENSVTSVDKAATGSDELLVVGEKGQIACRDYPHSRHLCGNFPFSSTPHERHCDQCHCYVCDSLAPCLKWGTGIFSTDHCHADDKAETWRIQRKNFKLGKAAPLPASTDYGTSLNIGHPQCSQILPLDIIQLSANSMLPNLASRSTAVRSCSSLNPVSQNQASRPTIMRTCSSSINSSLQNQFSRPNTIPVCSRATNLTIPNVANHGRCQESGYTLPRNRHQPHSFTRQLLGVRNHAIQRERGRGANSLGPQFLRSHLTSKEVDSVRSTLTTSNSAYGSSGFSNHVNLAEQYDKYHTATEFSNDRTCFGQSGVWVPKRLSYTHPTSEPTHLSNFGENPAASETWAYSHSLSQSNDNQNFYESCIQGNDVSPNYEASVDSSQHENVHQIGNQNENASGNITHCGITSQDGGNITQCGIQDAGQQKPHEESPCGTAGETDFSAFDPSCAENTSQSIESLIEWTPLQSSGSINKQPNVKESDTQLTESTKLISVDDFENWHFNVDSVPVVADSALPFELNVPSPEVSPNDAGMFSFDFENPWDGLAHA